MSSAAVPAKAQTKAALTKEDLIYLIRWSAQMDAERIQAIVDGAVLAAEQVQDKRIDLLEQDPEVTATELIFESLLTFVLESSLIGIAAQVAARRIVTPLLRKAGAAALSVRLLRQAPAMRREYLQALEFARRFGPYVTAQVRAANPISRDDLNAYHRFMRAVARADGHITEGIVGLAKGGVEARAHVPRTRELLPGDSPGVAILKAAQSYASTHRATIAMVHAQLEVAALGAKDEATLKKIDDAIQILPLEQDLSALRARYALLYEAVIWVILFGLADGSKIRVKGGLVSGPELELTGVKKPLLKYWESRFATLIEDWLSEMERSIGAARMNPQEGLLPLHGPFAEAQQATRVSLINQFFKRVASDLPKLPDDSWTTSGIKARK